MEDSELGIEKILLKFGRNAKLGKVIKELLDADCKVIYRGNTLNATNPEVIRQYDDGEAMRAGLAGEIRSYYLARTNVDRFYYIMLEDSVDQ